MEKLIEVAVLFDTYKNLLNEKQKNVIDGYYNEDLTLPEMAENLGISKQAISDMILRTVEKLYTFEKDLKLVERNEIIRNILFSLEKSVQDEQGKEKILEYIDRLYGQL